MSVDQALLRDIEELAHLFSLHGVVRCTHLVRGTLLHSGREAERVVRHVMGTTISTVFLNPR